MEHFEVLRIPTALAAEGIDSQLKLFDCYYLKRLALRKRRIFSRRKPR